MLHGVRSNGIAWTTADLNCSFGDQGVKAMEDAFSTKLQQLNNKCDQLTQWWEKVSSACA
jgi:hypothetical protein